MIIPTLSLFPWHDPLLVCSTKKILCRVTFFLNLYVVKMNVFDKPNEQSQTCLNFAMARTNGHDR